MRQVPENKTKIVIQAATDGTFGGIEIAESNLLGALKSNQGDWKTPIALFGQNAADESRLLTNSSLDGKKFVWIKGARPFFRHYFPLDFEALDRVFGDNGIAFGTNDPPELGSFREKNLSRMNSRRIIEYARARIQKSNEFTNGFIFSEEVFRAISIVLREHPVLMFWSSGSVLFNATIVALWQDGNRSRPLVVNCAKPTSFMEGWSQYSTSDVSFQNLAGEIKNVFGLDYDDVEKGYRVWQLSRNIGAEKSKATTPKNISLENARSFLSILLKARPESQRERRGQNKSLLRLCLMRDRKLWRLGEGSRRAMSRW